MGAHLTLCKNQKGEWLCHYSILQKNSLTPPNNIVSTPTNNSIWYMGKECFCWDGLENSPVILSDFYCNNTNFMLDTTGIWCNTEIIGKIALSEVNKTYDNIDTEDLICREIELNPLP